jgi:uncharacterized protein YdhG (YjbR/CyaY superfamily)
MPKPASVEAYIAAQPESSRETLECVRNAIRKALPKAEETISYDMPTYKIGDDIVLHFAGWKRHYSLYPVKTDVAAAFKDDLAPYELEKGTLRIPFSGGVPENLIKAIAKFRAKQMATRPKRSR